MQETGPPSAATQANELMRLFEADPVLADQLLHRYGPSNGSTTPALLAESVANNPEVPYFWRALALCWLALDDSRSSEERLSAFIKALHYMVFVPTTSLEWRYIYALYYTGRMMIQGQRFDLDMFVLVTNNAIEAGWFQAPIWASIARQRLLETGDVTRADKLVADLLQRVKTAPHFSREGLRLFVATHEHTHVPEPPLVAPTAT